MRLRPAKTLYLFLLFSDFSWELFRQQPVSQTCTHNYQRHFCNRPNISDKWISLAPFNVLTIVWQNLFFQNLSTYSQSISIMQKTFQSNVIWIMDIFGYIWIYCCEAFGQIICPYFLSPIKPTVWRTRWLSLGALAFWRTFQPITAQN